MFKSTFGTNCIYWYLHIKLFVVYSTIYLKLFFLDKIVLLLFFKKRECCNIRVTTLTYFGSSVIHHNSFIQSTILNGTWTKLIFIFTGEIPIKRKKVSPNYGYTIFGFQTIFYQSISYSFIVYILEVSMYFQVYTKMH